MSELAEDVEAPSDVAMRAREEFERKSPEYMAKVDKALENARYFKQHGRWPTVKDLFALRVASLPMNVRGR